MCEEIAIVHGYKGEISSGFTGAEDEDSLYLKLRRDGCPDICLEVRPDEAAAINYALTAVLYEREYRNL
jgi:hypothetical protein